MVKDFVYGQNQPTERSCRWYEEWWMDGTKNEIGIMRIQGKQIDSGKVIEGSVFSKAVVRKNDNETSTKG